MFNSIFFAFMGTVAAICTVFAVRMAYLENFCDSQSRDISKYDTATSIGSCGMAEGSASGVGAR